MRAIPSGWIRDALLAVGYAAILHVLFQTASVFWFLPAGWRFAVLLLSPWRRWPWFIAAELLLMFAFYASFVASGGGFAALDLGAGTLLAAALGPGLLRSLRPNLVETPASMATMLVTMLLAACASTLANLFFPFAESSLLSPVRLALQLILGDYIGMLVLVPVMWMVVRERPQPWVWNRWRIDVPCVLLPVLALYAALVAHADDAQVFFFSVLLCLVPAIYFAARTGWRGAALALAAASIAVAYSGAFAGNAELTAEAQGFLAVAGSATLLLGAAYDALRDNQLALRKHIAELRFSNDRLDRLAGDLRDAAQRNLDMAEETRRWITSELHDEIGQNLTALQTRVRLLERQAAPTGSDLTAEIGGILARMRQVVSGLMSSLRPAGLDDFGLAHALREGTIRSLLESSSIAYDVSIDDEADVVARLDDSAATTIYRIVQEVATNTVRHAGATRLRVRLRAQRAEGGCRVLLIIHDDGRGFDTNQRVAGIGLVGIRDRVLALGGRLRLRSGMGGTRTWVRVRLRINEGGSTET